MAVAIHIEIDVLFLIILSVIAWQISHSVSKQMSRVLFRYVTYGIGTALALDIIWMLIDGKMFPGGIMLNKIVNALFLGLSVTLGCLWYLYVLDVLNVKLTHNQSRLIMIPGTVFAILNIASIWTGWIFRINEKNVYERGGIGFTAQLVASLVVLFASLIHLIIRGIKATNPEEKHNINKLLSFYIIPVIGTIVSMPYAGMPGTWTCASVSIILIYMNDQEEAIIRDSLTGLNNRKTLLNTFSAYVHQVSDEKKLFLFMFDLNSFKEINDTYGHPVGDRALVEAAHLFTHAVGNIQGIVARYGGDEFIVMGFFPDEMSADRFAVQIKKDFDDWNKSHQAEYTLHTSCGFSCYREGMTLEDMIKTADQNLYNEKRITLKGASLR